jgi:hypothetical protein
MDPSLETYLLHDMPSLFSYKLPPCGLELQVSYQNVLHRLRRVWLHHAADPTTDTSILDICKLIKSHLEQEHRIQPLGTGPRYPWRRDNVFKYELKWAGYFVREAELMQSWPELNQKQKDRQDLTHKMRPIPKELGIVIKRKENWNSVLDMWVTWNDAKREDMFKKEKEKGGEGQAETDIKRDDESAGADSKVDEKKAQGQSQDE